MMDPVAAFLVVLNKGLHPETVERTIAAVHQLRGVAGISTVFDENGVAREIADVRQIREDVRDETLSRARAAGL